MLPPKKCIDCGVVFIPTGRNQKRDDECARAAELRYNILYNKGPRRMRRSYVRKGEIPPSEQPKITRIRVSVSPMTPRMTATQFQNLNVNNSRDIEKMNQVARGDKALARV